MVLALSTRWFGVRPLGAERLLSGLQEVGVRDCCLARGTPGPAPSDMISLRGSGVRAIGLEAGAPDRLDGPDAAIVAGHEAVLLARRVGAQHIVLDLGVAPGLSAEEARERDEEIRGRLRGDGPTDELKRDARELAAEVDRHLDASLEVVCRQLFELCRSAPEVRIGIRTPATLAGFPNQRALGLLFGELREKNLGYWHDVGAAMVQELLGVAAPRSWSGEFSDRTLGAHLHDVAGGDEHLPPGSGEVDFRVLRETFPASVPFVVDVDSRFPARELRLAVTLLGEAGY